MPVAGRHPEIHLPLFADVEGSASRSKVQRRAVINYDTSARYKPRAERPYNKISSSR